MAASCGWTPAVAEKQIFVAGQWRLFWWKFRRHKLALASLVIVVLLYLVAAFAEFLAPFPPDLSKQMADAFRKGGDKVDFRVLPAFRSEGHWLAETDGAEKIYGPILESGFKAGAVKSAKKK